nr:replication protein [Chloroflexota bacterium]
VLMPQLSDAELRVLLYIVRRTFGFKREADAISLSQMVSGITTREGQVLDRGTGLSKPPSPAD